MDKTKEFIRNHLQDNPADLALKAGKYPEVDIPLAVRQIAGHQVASLKIPFWSTHEEILYPQHLSLEQCSSEITARYKSTLTEGETLTDLTGGFGVDCAFMAGKMKKATYVERQEELTRIARHNFKILGLNQLSVVHSDSVAYLTAMEPVDVLYIDPARRDNKGGKVVAISDCEPDITQIEEQLLEKANNQVLVKLSPMLDIKKAILELSSVAGIHVISVHNECKELLLTLSRTPVQYPPIHCVNFTREGISQLFSFSFQQESDAACRFTNELKAYLYEPNASLLKAGAFKSIALAYGVEKLHPSSHLYTSDQLINAFPGRIFRVEKSFTPGKKEVKREMSDVTKANLTIRNFPAEVNDLRKKLKLKEGGDTYLFATTLADNKKVLIRCRKV